MLVKTYRRDPLFICAVFMMVLSLLAVREMYVVGWEICRMSVDVVGWEVSLRCDGLLRTKKKIK